MYLEQRDFRRSQTLDWHREYSMVSSSVLSHRLLPSLIQQADYNSPYALTRGRTRCFFVKNTIWSPEMIHSLFPTCLTFFRRFRTRPALHHKESGHRVLDYQFQYPTHVKRRKHQKTLDFARFLIGVNNTCTSFV